MRCDKTGAVVARGIGIGLIVMGICSGLGSFVSFEPAATSGWTSYSPLATSTTITRTTVTSMSYTTYATLWIPSVLQVIAGSGFILFSKWIGTWLARGLDGDEKP